jgi:hypothetical protein
MEVKVGVSFPKLAGNELEELLVAGLSWLTAGIFWAFSFPFPTSLHPHSEGEVDGQKLLS